MNVVFFVDGLINLPKVGLIGRGPGAFQRLFTAAVRLLFAKPFRNR